MNSNIDGVCGQCDAIKITCAEIENQIAVEYVRVQRASDSDSYHWIVEADLQSGTTLPENHDTSPLQLQCQLQSDSGDSVFTLIDAHILHRADPRLRYGAKILCHEVISPN